MFLKIVFFLYVMLFSFLYTRLKLTKYITSCNEVNYSDDFHVSFILTIFSCLV